MPDFSKRSRDVEIMDDLACSGEVVNQTLRELETINDLLGGNYVTINGISQLVRESNTRKISVVDLGCGSGDMLWLIRKWSDKKKLDLQLTGIDANPFIIAYAREHTPTQCSIDYQVKDIFSEDFKAKNFDIAIGTLFFHHFSNNQLIEFFGKLKEVRLGFVVNDIHRHWFAYYSIRSLTKFLSKSPMVQNDAPLSVLRAFLKSDLKEILEKAGIVNYKIKWMWAFRWQVIVFNR